jgi:crossover junction endodeoxyribonuclease RusA
MNRESTRVNPNPEVFSTPGTAVNIDLPLPPKETNPNARSHWRPKAAATKRQRSAAAVLARQATQFACYGFPWKAATVQATFYRGRRIDADNALASLKASFDGLADAGIIANDSGLTHLPVVQVTGKATGGRRGVELRIVNGNP